MTQTLVAGVFLFVTAMAAAGAAVALGLAEKRAMVRDLLKTLETRDVGMPAAVQAEQPKRLPQGGYAP